MKCIYHNDMDGRCSGSIVAYFANDYNPDNFIEADYSAFPIDKISPNDIVYIVDYSFTADTVHNLHKLINELHCDVIWIDHHTSSIELSNKSEYAWLNDIPGIRSEKLSGAGLTYCYFMHTALVPELLPRYIAYVDDYDRWVYRLGDATTAFKLGIETVPYDALDSIWKSLWRLDDKCDELLAVGEIIKNYIDKTNAIYLKNYGFQSTIAGISCFVVNKRSNSWIFGDKIHEYPLVATVVFDGEWFLYSLYSESEDIDCSKIAESYGGGGHKGAAGFRSKQLIFTKTI